MSHWGPIVYLAHLMQPVLAAIEHFVHDWGLAVILLTLTVRLILFPLSIRQARFAYQNRLFTGALKELKASYKNDPDQLQEETRKLAVQHKFNPFSMMGTMILQMPIISAIYAVFYHFGNDITSVIVPWAETLAKFDPTHLLPMLVAAVTASGSLVPMLEPEMMGQVNSMGKWLPMMVMFPVMLFFLWKAPVAIALYMGTTSFWGMAERAFLRTPFAIKKFRLRPGVSEGV